MIKSAIKKQAFIDECEKLFESYCQKGWVENSHRKPIMYSPGSIARAGNQADTMEAKKTGHKSAKSISSRVFREDAYMDNSIISSVTDLTRCTMILDSFRQVPNILLELKKRLPFVYVSICDHSEEDGYSAIHLKGLNEQGIPYEIQLHTPESFYLKQISEYEYSHWREFNYQAEVNKINQIINPKQRQFAQQLLDKTLAMNKQDKKQCENLYRLMHSIADARISDPALNQKIKSVVDIINKDYRDNLINNNFVNSILNEHILKIDHAIKMKNFTQDDLTELLSKSKLIQETLPDSQGDLIEQCEQVLQLIYKPSPMHVSKSESHKTYYFKKNSKTAPNNLYRNHSTEIQEDIQDIEKTLE